jgi:hypothetical protein
MRRSTLSSCCALTLFALTLFALTAPAQAAASLKFGDARPASVAFADIAKPDTTARLAVCNFGSSTLRHVRASATGFGFKVGKMPVADTAVLALARLTAKGATLGIGVCRGIALAPATGAPTFDYGSYRGVVKVTAPGSAPAQLPLTITGPAVAAQSVTDTVKIKVVHNGFSPLGGGDGDQKRYVTLKQPANGATPGIAGGCAEGDKMPSRSCPAIGVVAHDEDTGEISVGGPTPRAENGVIRLPVHIHGARVVGDYQGTIDPGHTGVAADAIAVTVSVTDAWWCALIALLIGCIFALGPQLWAGRWRLSNQLRKEAKGLSELYDEATSNFHSYGPPKFPQIRRPGSEKITRYGEQITSAVRAYKLGMVFLDTRTDAYREIVKSITNAKDDAACWSDESGLHASLTQLQMALADLQTWLGRYDFAPEDPAVAKTAAAVLAEHALAIGEAIKLKADADNATALLRDWRRLATEVMQLQLWWRALAQTDGTLTQAEADMFIRAAARITQYKRELVRVASSDDLAELGVKARLAAIYEDLAYLGGRFNVGEPSPEAVPGELRGQWAKLGIAPSDARWLAQEPKGRTAKVGRVDPVEREPAQVARIRWTPRILADAVCILLAILVAIVAAMLALVDGKNFGTLGDYLTVIVVGAAAQTTITSVVPKFNMFLQDLLGTPLESEAKPAADS